MILLIVLVCKVVRRVAQIVLVTVDPRTGDFDCLCVADGAITGAGFELVTCQRAIAALSFFEPPFELVRNAFIKGSG